MPEERYSETAKRALFLANLEANETGSPEMRPEQLLQGVITADRDHIASALTQMSRDLIQEQLLRNRRTGERPATSGQVPLGPECKRAMAYAEEEADKFGRKEVAADMVLLGLIREPKGLAAKLLKQYDASYENVCERLGLPVSAAAPPAAAGGGFFSKLKKAVKG
jgi:ATP-dependent Clp protease ATP-binding subunit ClpA